MSERQIVVVGAGQSGLSAALSLKDVGLDPLVLERADAVASAWRGRYDRLKLNTWRAHSHLPDRPFPKGTPTFPARDQVVRHLERHAAEEGLEFRLGTEVERIDRDGDRWLVTTREDNIRSPQVVVATGYENDPFVPDWPGRDRFEGELLHARDYKRPAPYAGKRVLVVGPGCTGMEIAFDLAEGGAAKVWLAARTPPNVMLREGPGGVPGDVIGSVLLHTPVRFADWFAHFGRPHGPRRPDRARASGARGGRVLAVAPARAWRRRSSTRTSSRRSRTGAIEIVRGVESLATNARRACRRRHGRSRRDHLRDRLSPRTGAAGRPSRRARRARRAAGARHRSRPPQGFASSGTSRVPAVSAIWPRRRSARPG